MSEGRKFAQKPNFKPIDVSGFSVRLQALHKEAIEAGYMITAHAIHAAVRAIGWEVSSVEATSRTNKDMFHKKAVDAVREAIA